MEKIPIKVIKAMNCRWWANHMYLLTLHSSWPLTCPPHNLVQSFYLKSRITIFRVWLIKVCKVLLHNLV